MIVNPIYAASAHVPKENNQQRIEEIVLSVKGVNGVQ